MNKLPRKGRKTIDLPKDLVNKLNAKYENNKSGLAEIGITTFQGYISKVLSTHLKEDIQLEDQG
jgi:hypothetical protein